MAIVDGPLIAACKAIIDAEFGAIPAGLDSGVVDAYRMKLARCIAKAAQYVRDNGQVQVGIHSTVNTVDNTAITIETGTLI